MRFQVVDEALEVRVSNLELLDLKKVPSIGNRYGIVEGLKMPFDARLTVSRELGGVVCCPRQLSLIPDPEYVNHENEVLHALKAHPFRARIDAAQDIDITVPNAMIRDVRIAGCDIPWDSVEMPLGWSMNHPAIKQLPPRGIAFIVDYSLDSQYLGFGSE